MHKDTRNVITFASLIPQWKNNICHIYDEDGNQLDGLDESNPSYDSIANKLADLYLKELNSITIKFPIEIKGVLVELGSRVKDLAFEKCANYIPLTESSIFKLDIDLGIKIKDNPVSSETLNLFYELSAREQKIARLPINISFGPLDGYSKRWIGIIANSIAMELVNTNFNPLYIGNYHRTFDNPEYIYEFYKNTLDVFSFKNFE